MTITIKDLMLNMPKSFIAQKAEGLEAVIQFKFTGPDAGEWFVTIKDGKCSSEQGVHPSPTATLSADSNDYIKIVSGELDGMQAYVQEKIKISGDRTLAMSLMRLFE